MQEPLFLVVDLFCGAGGTTTGFDMADGTAKVIACVNHDPIAIKSHWANHPEVKHFEEDIRTLDLTDLITLVAFMRKRYPRAKLILWASLECTNFSKAKGGLPRDADSRTLADHLDRYIVALQPDYVQIENVVEFMSWGPLDEKGKPVSKKNGQDWLRWRKSICDLGYRDEWKELNSANFGAYTSRNRLFGIFAKGNLPIAWPEPTHAKVPTKASGMFSCGLQPWKPVRDVLDFSDEGESIFNRKKPLSDNTLERIYAGLLKYVTKGDKAFISKYYSGKPSGKNIPVGGPAGTVTCVDGQALVQTTPRGNSQHSSVDVPLGTLTTKDRAALIQPDFLLKYNSCDRNGRHTPPSVDQPCPVVSTQNRLGLVQPQLFTAIPQNQSIDAPAGTIMTNDKHSVVMTDSFLMPTNYDNGPKSLNDPSPTITANRKYHYIVNPSHGGHCTSTEAPCPVIVARQDKAPLYCVQALEGQYQIPVYDNDSAIMCKIKEFMAEHGLVDIKMRMLRILELLQIQGFPAGYKLNGTQADRKKFIGNSVVPLVVKEWTLAMAGKFTDTKRKAA